jgi:Flp pilus assembly pilin Flp
MRKGLEFAAKLCFDEEAATIVEYTLLIMFVAMACFAAIATLGTSLKGPFQNVTSGLS